MNDLRMAGAKDGDRDISEHPKHGRKSRQQRFFGKSSHSKSPVYTEDFRKPREGPGQDTNSERPERNLSCNVWLIYRLRANKKQK